MKPTIFLAVCVWAFVMWGPDLGTVEFGPMPWHAPGTATYSAPVGALIGGLLLAFIFVLLLARIVRTVLRRLGGRQTMPAAENMADTFASKPRSEDVARSNSLTESESIHSNSVDLALPGISPDSNLSLRMARLVEEQLDDTPQVLTRVGSDKNLLARSTVWLLSAGAFCVVIVVVTLLQIYFSPYHTCVRAMKVEGQRGAEINCAVATGGR